MRFYLSAASSEIELAEHWIHELESHGHRCSYDWTRDVRANQREGKTDRDLDNIGRMLVLQRDFEGIAAADLFWMLIPHADSIGAWVEFGYALRCYRELEPISRPIIVSGPDDRGIFLSAASIWVPSHQEAFTAIEREYARASS